MYFAALRVAEISTSWGTVLVAWGDTQREYKTEYKYKLNWLFNQVTSATFREFSPSGRLHKKTRTGASSTSEWLFDYM